MLILILGCLILPHTPLYKNITLALDYFKIDSIQALLDKKANKAEVKSMLATLAEKVRNNEITIESHTRSIADNATNIETNTNDITDLKNLTASHSTQISNNTVDIDDLQALTERHTGNIEILIQKDMQKETDITNLQTRDIQHDNAIQALGEFIWTIRNIWIMKV